MSKEICKRQCSIRLLRIAENDIVGVINDSGTQVAQYRYDVWGKPLAILDGSGADVSGNPSHIANVNPFRYRGYYYDPTTGRFISPDVLVSTGQGVLGHNLYAYCFINSINMSDPEGMLGQDTLIGAVGGALVSTTSYLMNTSSGDITIGGVLTAAGVGVALTSAVSAGYTYATTEGSTGERLACTVVFVAFAGGSAGNALGNIVANNVSTGAGFVLGTAFGSYIAGETMDCFSVGVQYCIKSIRK